MPCRRGHGPRGRGRLQVPSSHSRSRLMTASPIFTAWMYKPFDFDPNKKYPLIEYVYPGPQTESVGCHVQPAQHQRHAGEFRLHRDHGRQPRRCNPNRSKWYHTFGYNNLRDYGLADKKTAAEQLAERYSFIDIDRVWHVGTLGRRLHDRRFHADLSRLLQSGLVGIGQSRKQHLQQHLERKAPTAQRKSPTTRATPPSSIPSTRIRRSRRTSKVT